MGGPTPGGSPVAFAGATALTVTQVAAALIPPAWTTSVVMYLNQCDPQAMLDAGLKWADNYDQLGNAQEAANSTNLPKDEWQGKDRDAYDARIDEYRSQITGSKQLAFAVGSAMTITAALCFLVVVAMVVIAALIALYAVYVAAALAGLFTYPAVLASASAFAIECTSFLESVSGLVASVAAGGAAVITGAMALDIGWQKAHGNDAALDDFKNGLRDASDNMVWGTISRLERTATAALMKVGGGTPLGRNDPALRMPSPVGNPARGGGSLGTSGVWTGGNITDHFAGAAGDKNKRDEGLFEDPPAE
ncbi:hypothetical protein [Actinomadura bangladeshensis]|uniref:Uncharacterized protein n=1 Tax=Actinomadura bangladeshensis TaxID=453573 RepID=A0A4R4PBG8_9ACTN|nr:hypothetical protein [Actinomadura bangladeshensis]TDC19745.1 hypothetical protein E1284_02735 [Actinomadura bangladeshensis]